MNVARNREWIPFLGGRLPNFRGSAMNVAGAVASSRALCKNFRCSKFLFLAALLCFAASPRLTFAQQYSSEMFSGMRWRLIGPHRAGRVTAVAGVVGQPNVYYFGTPGGGVWKTTDAGRMWVPIFDDAHVASIGASAVAPSDPNVIYVGTGEQTRGNGVYKSTDAGATWVYTGLADTHFIDAILVDPHDPNLVLVGASGDSTAGPARGVFRSTDGGKNWAKVLFKDERTGVADMCFDPGDSHVVYATLWGLRPEPGEKSPAGPEAWIYKSTDEGATWQPAGDSGLPSENRGRIGIAVAPGNSGRRLFAILRDGLYRSEDASATWARITTDSRIVGNGYFSRVFVDPKNADAVYVMQTSTYRSTDGGKTFAAFKGAPSGEDHHVLWIAQDDSQRILLGTDQGATISVDGGKSWGDWFNQPTGQFYHVSTDSTFPYHAYAAQQDSGTAIVPHRTDFGEITYRDWFSSGGFESGYIAADPLNQNFVYSIGWFGTVLRLDRATGQVATIFVSPPSYRTAWETPLVFSPRDPHTLYFGSQYVLKTTDGGVTWKEISPDLTSDSKKPAAANKTDGEHALGGDEEREEAQSGERGGTIQTIASSPIEAPEIWAGTSNGFIKFTRDGISWQDVTPAGLPAKSSVLLLEASSFDANTAYAAVVARHDVHPYFYRTRDAGKTWEKIVAGLPEVGVARVLREDPVRKGLLYAGTETGVYVSWDSGDHWQPLQLNLPTASVRDLAVHGRDLVAATFGRALWILDDLSPLRQASADVSKTPAYLYRPATALRVRWDNHQETPLSAEMPAGQNPPDGAFLDYFLKAKPKGEITLDIFDQKGTRIRHYSSVPPPPDTRLANVPDYWFAAPEVLDTQPGMHRFVWDLRGENPEALTFSFYGNLLDYIEYTLADHAIPGQTPRYQPQGVLVAPGTYETVLNVDKTAYRQRLVVELDPRVHISQADLLAQCDLAEKIAAAMAASFDSFQRTAALRAAIAARQKDLAGNAQAKKTLDELGAVEKQLTELADHSEAPAGFGAVNRDLTRYFIMIEGADIRPPESARHAVSEACGALKKDLGRWKQLNSDAVPTLNNQLVNYKLPALPVSATPSSDVACTE